MSTLDWIAVDWGTTHCRAWAIGPSGQVLSEASSSDGMGGLRPDQFEAALLNLVEPWLDVTTVDVVACGMVGSRQGWVEAPYAQVPCAPADTETVLAPTKDVRLRVQIVPGLKQIDPADVMRGEETQIAGALSLSPNFDGVMVLPGTHSKWVQISADEVVSFRSFMTGEMFGLLSRASVLKHSMDDGWDGAAFSEAVEETLSRPESLASKLFSIRAETLLKGLPGAAARARLSGLLIGAELAATKPYWLGMPVSILGADALGDAYGAALAAQGIEAKMIAPVDATLAGLSAARMKQKETT
ncbi:MAG: 2-dehydro-3-deoxygalactonokinase [Dinoroseobacter sp.]|nr:2-dehydro-3-deoxygalactonokinase [Dinoroseobacter sp.]